MPGSRTMAGTDPAGSRRGQAPITGPREEGRRSRREILPRSQKHAASRSVRAVIRRYLFLARTDIPAASSGRTPAPSRHPVVSPYRRPPPYPRPARCCVCRLLHWPRSVWRLGRAPPGSVPGPWVQLGLYAPWRADGGSMQDPNTLDPESQVGGAPPSPPPAEEQAGEVPPTEVTTESAADHEACAGTAADEAVGASEEPAGRTADEPAVEATDAPAAEADDEGLGHQPLKRPTRQRPKRMTKGSAKRPDPFRPRKVPSKRRPRGSPR